MDFYSIKKDWETHKDMVNDLEKKIEIFLSKPLSRSWCAESRKQVKEIRALGKKMRKNFIRQIQDIKSDYS
ncbi:MAG: hypothetical protein WC466_09795 [Candidatus Izemoplasmatales bacterium]